MWPSKTCIRYHVGSHYGVKKDDPLEHNFGIRKTWKIGGGRWCKHGK